MVANFDELYLQVTKTEGSCFELQIPQSFKIDLSDIVNLWRFTTFYTGQQEVAGKKMHSFEFDLQDFWKVIGKKAKNQKNNFDENNKNGTLRLFSTDSIIPDRIQIDLIDENLVFEKVSSSFEVDNKMERKYSCYEGVSELKEFMEEHNEKLSALLESYI